ncbi:sigma-70 family RNA polymerase sigma factor [Butyrivibrio sp. X503]|uniref:RNA polymerase sigma factor n=1 Tax=Butyrivibrio sp. X503 TaxID=2364878 RepID=UPI000EAA3229|nr:sigma-70 family RNA polymerase sigma factor [Butyrivibrio sp. X503]RKM58099.1 sigma-70 family RNA polymerase sigma factor [Butyrivibrio sp. X503]
MNPDNKTLPSDDELYNDYLKGKQEAGDKLMLRYGDALTSYLFYFIGDYHDAEDLMLDSFAAILVRKPKIGAGCFKAYLFKTARHKACRLWRKKLKQSEFSLPDDIISEEASPEKKTVIDENISSLHKCLNLIPTQYREALWLKYAMDLSYDQAAQIMACSKKKIDNLLSNGKKTLRKELEREGITRYEI